MICPGPGNGKVLLPVYIGQRFHKRKSAGWKSRYAPLYRAWTVYRQTALEKWLFTKSCLVLKMIQDITMFQMYFKYIIESAFQIGIDVTHRVWVVIVKSCIFEMVLLVPCLLLLN